MNFYYKLSETIVSLSRLWNDVLSAPQNLGTAKGYPQRDAQNPAYAAMPEAIKDAPWNISEADLLSQSHDVMIYKNSVAGVTYPPIILEKSFDEAGQATGFKGLPESGLIGPGVLGKGMYEGKPSPLTRAADVILLTQDKKTGEIGCLLGQRPEYCFPGGFVDELENPVFTAVREFFEEVLVASFDLGEEAENFLQGRDWTDLGSEEKTRLCEILDVPVSHAKEPFMAEFKYKVLAEQKPEAIEDITHYLRSLAHESYAGFVSADPRNCGRAIYTNAFSLVIEEQDLADILNKHGLSMDVESDEIGKLVPVKITPELLIQDYKETKSPGMYASHGPVLLYAIAHQIKLGNIDPQLKYAAQQIDDILKAVREDISPEPQTLQSGRSHKYTPR
jgi:hypothetical protein